MSAGIDALGLVLAIYPILIQTVDWYSGKVTSRDVSLLAESLKTHKGIFLNTVESMLRSIVSQAELQVLLNNLEGDAWKDPTLATRVKAYLGRDADGILEKIDEIYKTLLKLGKKLPSRSKAAKDRDLVERAKKIIKTFVQGSLYKSDLEKLKTRIMEFRTLTQSSIKLASKRNAIPKPLFDLESIQKCADGLHKALQDGLRCDCAQPHPANMELQLWTQAGDEGASHAKFRFSLLFAHDAENAQPDHWITAETTLPDDSNTANAGSAQMIADLCKELKQSEAQFSSSPASSPSTPLSTSPTLSASPIGRRRRLGSISCKDHTFDLSTSELSAARPMMTSIKLGEVFQKREMLTNKHRVQLGKMLAWGVLQISSTKWLKGQWTRDNVLLVLDEQKRPQPFIRHEFESARRNSTASTLSPSSPLSIDKWVQNTTLFALGIFLIELCYNKSIEDLAIDDENDTEGHRRTLTPMLTALRLSRCIQDELGMLYAQAVHGCLHFPFSDRDQNGRSVESAQFVKTMMRDIIDPLEALAKSFEPQAQTTI